MVESIPSDGARSRPQSKFVDNPDQGEAGKLLAYEAWKESIHYHQDIEYRDDMSEARAEYLKKNLDERHKEIKLLENSRLGWTGKAAGFAGGVVGSLPHFEALFAAWLVGLLMFKIYLRCKAAIINYFS